MQRMPLNFVSHVCHVYFSHELMVYLSTCGYHVNSRVIGWEIGGHVFH